jgi:hypothetical protein
MDVRSSERQLKSSSYDRTGSSVRIRCFRSVYASANIGIAAQNNLGDFVSDIRPKIGIYPFILGKTRDEIRSAAGEPNSVEKCPAPEGGDEIWHYDESNLRLSFSPDEQWRLTSIDCKGSEYEIGGISFVGTGEMALIPQTILAGIEDVIFESDHEEFGRCYTSQNHSLMFWVVDNVVQNFTIMLSYDASGNNPVWPH